MFLMSQRIKHHQQQLPPSWRTGVSPTVDRAVECILAIEGEWLINPEQRKAFSVLEGWDNDDDETATNV